MNAAAPIETLAALADIEILAPPPPTMSLPMLSVFVLLLAIAATIGFFLHRRHKTPAAISPPTLADEALQRLDALQREWRAGESNDRETAYRLCALLRVGMALPRLDPSRPPAGTAPSEWSACLRALHEQRYGAHNTTAIDESTFERLRQWLTTYRATIAMAAVADV